jgi:hypothetical protein
LEIEQKALIASEKVSTVLSKTNEALQVFMRLQEEGFRKEVSKEIGVL